MGDIIERAEKLKDMYGNIYGSKEYIEKLNKTYFLTGILKSSGDINYFSAFNERNDEVENAIDKMVEDFEDFAEILHLIDSGMRKRTIDFLNGLDGLLQITGSGSSDVRTAKEYLELKKGSTGRQSRASERDIKDAAKKVYSGVSGSRMSSSSRVDVLKKAGSDGLSRAAGSDKEKADYLNQLVGRNREEKEYFRDVMIQYQHQYKNGGTYKGDAGKPLCSGEYITYYENKIFSDTGFKSKLNHFNYKAFFEAQLKELASSLEEDLARGTEGKNYIEEGCQQNIRAVLAELAKFGIVIDKFEEKWAPFIMPDVTQKLFAIMRQAETDGLALQKSYPNPLNFGSRCKKFTEAVGADSNYDLKSKSDWNSPWYYFDGWILRFDDPGNLAYGVILKATFSDAIFEKNQLFGHAGAGGAQILDNIIHPGEDLVEHLIQERADIIERLKNKKTIETNDGFYNSVFETKPYEGQMPNWELLKDIGTLFDDPRDYNAVEKGYEYYNNKRYR